LLADHQQLASELALLAQARDAGIARINEMQIQYEMAQAEWSVREQNLLDEERERCAELGEKEEEWRLKETHLRESIAELRDELRVREEDADIKETEWTSTEQLSKQQIDDLTALNERLQQEMADRQQKLRDAQSRVIELEQANKQQQEEWAAKRRQYLELMKEKKLSWQKREEAHIEKHKVALKQMQLLKVDYANRQEAMQRTIDEQENQHKQLDKHYAVLSESHDALKAQFKRWIPALQQYGLLPQSGPISTPRIPAATVTSAVATATPVAQASVVACTPSITSSVRSTSAAPTPMADMSNR
jgi:chromosome segregation ATPase